MPSHHAREVPVRDDFPSSPSSGYQAGGFQVDPNRIRHALEHAVQARLLSQPELRFSSLVVRRVPNGVCLQGVLETDAESPDVCTLAQTVAGVNRVINRLVVVPGK